MERVGVVYVYKSLVIVSIIHQIILEGTRLSQYNSVYIYGLNYIRKKSGYEKILGDRYGLD